MISMARRLRKVGTPKAVGFVRHQVAAVVSRASLTVLLVGLVAGIPLGIAAGRGAWTLFAHGFGVVDADIVPWKQVAWVAVATLVAAELIAAAPALLASRVRPVDLFREGARRQLPALVHLGQPKAPVCVMQVGRVRPDTSSRALPAPSTRTGGSVASRARVVAPLLGAVLSAGALAAAVAAPAAAASGGAGSSPITLPLPSPLPALTLPPVVSLTSPSLGAPQISLPTETRTIPQMQVALLADLNAERAAAGLGSLTTQPWAQSVAMAHSADMAAARNIWHNYSGFVDVAHQAVDAYVNGENVGMAFTLDEADAALMASPGHRYNILYPLFNEVGIGIARDGIGYVYVTEDFVDIRPPGSAPPPVTHATTAAQPARAAQPAATSPPPPAPAATPAPGATPIVTPAPTALTASSGAAQPLASGKTVLTARRSGVPWPVVALMALMALAAAMAAGLGGAALRRLHGRHQA